MSQTLCVLFAGRCDAQDAVDTMMQCKPAAFADRLAPGIAGMVMFIVSELAMDRPCLTVSAVRNPPKALMEACKRALTGRPHQHVELVYSVWGKLPQQLITGAVHSEPVCFHDGMCDKVPQPSDPPVKSVTDSPSVTSRQAPASRCRKAASSLQVSERLARMGSGWQSPLSQQQSKSSDASGPSTLPLWLIRW